MSYPVPPTSAVGNLQRDIYQLQNDLRQKPNQHELYALARRVDELERLVRTLSRDVVAINARLQQLEDSRLLTTPMDF
jgi:predicted  nucleic acid-binding Zn-ribbon protein